ncbi:hypothetical protein [Georgfuchsia toluolica]|uniref:hypothetical protein n=1 Tax=Georgfuchsia toluolica TaxID=424218 RepID=UPI001C7385A3|nr:hypothetical protein [Georgfuchsia toluolica]
MEILKLEKNQPSSDMKSINLLRSAGPLSARCARIGPGWGLASTPGRASRNNGGPGFFIANPAYNADRGPVRIIGRRLHLEY